VPVITDYIEHAAYKRYIFVKDDVELRDKMMMELNEKGVPALLFWIMFRGLPRKGIRQYWI